MDLVNKIQLTQGREALIDADMYPILSRFKWCVISGRGKPYPARGMRVAGKQKTILMHRQIIEAKPGQIVDHINGNSFDNRRENLRICDYFGNNRNAKVSVTSSTGLKGVFKRPVLRKPARYWVSINVKGETIYLGSFACPIEAAKAYDKAALKYFGEFAWLNFPKESA